MELKLLKLGESAGELIMGRPFVRRQHTDAKGIPYQHYADGSKQYNPLFVASAALDEYQKLPSAKAAARFEALCDWLAQNATSRDSSLWLPYNFPYPKFDLQAPWYSALAQAEALHAFSLRWQHTKDPVWLTRRKALAYTLLPPSPLALPLPGDAIWYVEYPSKTAPYVLNGHCAVLLHLYQSNQIQPDPLLQKLFDQGYQALIPNIQRFDHHGFSLYSEKGELAGRLYHQRHIDQMNRLNQIRPHPSLQKYYRIWQSTDRMPVIIQHFYNPRPKRIALFIISFLLIWLLCEAATRLLRLG